MTVLLAIDHERVRIVEHRRIAIGRRERQQHPVVDLHRTAVEIVVLQHEAGHRDRRVRAEELLEREHHHVGIVGETLAVLGMLREVPQRRADRRPCGVDAGDQEQHDRAAHVFGLELHAVDLGVEHVRREVVARIVEVVGDLHVEVGVELLAGLLAHRDRLVDQFERVVHELAEEVLVLLGEAEHAPDHVHRTVLCVVDRSIDDRLAGGDISDLVEQLVAQPADLGLPRFDLLRRERWQQQTPGDVVERRIARDRRREPDRGWDVGPTGVDDDAPAREVLGVVCDLVHEFVGDRRPHSAVAVGVGDRAS